MLMGEEISSCSKLGVVEVRSRISLYRASLLTIALQREQCNQARLKTNHNTLFRVGHYM